MLYDRHRGESADRTRFIQDSVSVHRVSKNDTDVAHLNFDTHQPLLINFCRDVAERVCSQYSDVTRLMSARPIVKYGDMNHSMLWYMVCHSRTSPYLTSFNIADWEIFQSKPLRRCWTSSWNNLTLSTCVSLTCWNTPSNSTSIRDSLKTDTKVGWTLLVLITSIILVNLCTLPPEFLSNSVRSEPIIIIVNTRNLKEFWRKWLWVC